MSVGRLVELERTEANGRKLSIHRRDLDGETWFYFDYDLGYCAGRERHDKYEDALARYRATRDWTP